MTAPSPAASHADKIKWITDAYKELYAQHNSFAPTLEQDVAKVTLDDDEKEVSFEEQTRRDFVDIGGLEVLLRRKEEKKEEESKEDKERKQDASSSS
jgi:hypothetical protein